MQICLSPPLRPPSSLPSRRFRRHFVLLVCVFFFYRMLTRCAHMMPSCCSAVNLTDTILPAKLLESVTRRPNSSLYPDGQTRVGEQHVATSATDHRHVDLLIPTHHCCHKTRSPSCTSCQSMALFIPVTPACKSCRHNPYTRSDVSRLALHLQIIGRHADTMCVFNVLCFSTDQIGSWSDL